MSTHMQAVLAVQSNDHVGEGPVWDAVQQRVLWADHHIGVIHEARADGAGGWRETRRWNLRRPIAAVIPRSRGGLVIAAGTEILLFDETGEGSGQVLARIDVDASVRMNDAKCDPQGRLWVDTLTPDFRPGAAALYRVDPDGTVATMLEGVTLGNGLDWSPDGRTFYFVDTVSRNIDAFDFDAVRGTISNRRALVTLEWGKGAPNGVAVDRNGCLWVAATGAGEVQCYSPDGKLLRSVGIATPGATSCAFGGSDGGDLFITSRSGRMPDIALTLGCTPEMLENSGPQAGCLFVCRPGVTGAPAAAFAG